MALLTRESQHPEVVGAMRPSMWHMMADDFASVMSSWVSCEALARSGSQRHFFVDSVSRVVQKGLGRGRTGDPSAWVEVSMAWFSCSHMTWEMLPMHSAWMERDGGRKKASATDIDRARERERE